MTAPVMPDAESVVRDWVRNNPAMEALIGQRAFFAKPRQDTVPPWITISRSGGAPDKYVPIDTPLIDLNVWGGIKDKKSAADPAKALASEIIAIQSGTVAAGGIILGAFITMGPWWYPEHDNDRARYVITAQFTIRGT